MVWGFIELLIGSHLTDFFCGRNSSPLVMRYLVSYLVLSQSLNLIQGLDPFKPSIASSSLLLMTRLYLAMFFTFNIAIFRGCIHLYVGEMSGMMNDKLRA